MKSMQAITPMVVLLVCSSASDQTSRTTPCDDANGSQWQVYVDWHHQFCFRYPSSYAPVPHPKANCRGPKLDDKKVNANIGVCFLNEQFRPAALVKMAPTEVEDPPESKHIGQNTFYYYGPGGGGAQYPDGYYFNLRGKILVIDFHGPYDDADKTPTPATKRMEEKVLATFREF